MSNILNILYITTIPSPYRVAFFNELGKRCQLTVLFEKKRSDERDKSWDEYDFTYFKGIFMKGKRVSVNTAFCPEVVRRINKEKYDAIICGNIATPTGILELLYMKLRKKKYLIEADGASAKSGKGIKEMLKYFLIYSADGYFSSSLECDEYFKKYGAQQDEIYRYPFSSLLRDDLIEKVISDEEKQKIKKKLHIDEEKIVISVGRFSYNNGYGKGFDTLLKVAEDLDNSIGVYIIGDEPTEEFISMKAAKGDKLSNLHFVGFLRKPELAEYYKLADIFVLLSRGEAWGLVINEAMAYGLPVITTYSCVAGVELIKNDLNGYLVDSENNKDVVKYIKDMLENDLKRKQMAQASLIKIKKYTIEDMAEAHIKALQNRGV